jgi:hypothetical protein
VHALLIHAYLGSLPESIRVVRYLDASQTTLLSLPFRKCTPESGSGSHRNISEHHSHTSCLPPLHYSNTTNPPMEIAAVSGTEPSPDQFLRKRGKTRSWPPREKGIVYDPAKQSLEIHRIKKIERSSKLPACGIYATVVITFDV